MNTEAVKVPGARVLVTGGTGFIGSHLVARLLERGFAVHIITSNATGLYPYRLLQIREQVIVHQADVCDFAAVSRVVFDIDPTVVIHLAAVTRVGDAWDYEDLYIRVNVIGTINMVRAVRSINALRRFVYVSSSEVYGQTQAPFIETAEVRPASPYAISKYAAEQYCRTAFEAFGLPAVLVRPFNVYGPSQAPNRIIPEAIVAGLSGRTFRMTLGTQTRSFNYVDDIVDGLILAASGPIKLGVPYNLDSEVEISVKDVVLKLRDLMGGSLKLSIGTVRERPNEIMRMVGNSEKARSELEWNPRASLDVGLRRTIEWYRQEHSRGGSPFMVTPPRLRV